MVNGFLSILNNSAALKLLLVVLVLFVNGAVQVSAEEPHPYKATTADECIQEKECVWYVLDKYTLRPNQTEMDDEKIILWTRDVQIFTVGDEDAAIPLRAEIEEFLKPINAITPMDVRVDKTANFFLVVTDDIVGSYRSYYFGLFDKLMPASMMREIGLTIDDMAKIETPCVQLSNRNYVVNEYTSSVSFVRIKNLDQACWKTDIYTTLGARNVGDVFPQNGTNLNALQYFILEILYHPKVKSGMTIGEFKSVFDDVYADAIEERK